MRQKIENIWCLFKWGHAIMQAGAKPHPLICLKALGTKIHHEIDFWKMWKIARSEYIEWTICWLIYYTWAEVRAGIWFKIQYTKCLAFIFLEIHFQICQCRYNNWVMDGGEEICDSFYWLSYWLPPCNLMISSYTLFKLFWTCIKLFCKYKKNMEKNSICNICKK